MVKAGDRWETEVGVVTGDGVSSDAERDTTYECLRSGRLAISSFAASSWWTATLKRFQKLGSWIVAMVAATRDAAVDALEKECGDSGLLPTTSR